MKKFILSMIALLMAFSMTAQEQTDNTETQEVFCLIACRAKLFSTKVSVTIDYGQKVNFWSFTKNSDTTLVDENGSKLEFNSVIDACNYLSAQGWNFVSAYAMHDPTKGNSCYHYLFKKKIPKGEKATFSTKSNTPKTDINSSAEWSDNLTEEQLQEIEQTMQVRRQRRNDIY